MKEDVMMCGTELDLASVIMELRVEEARRLAAAHRVVTPSNKWLQREVGLLLALVGAWLASLGEQLAHTARVQPSI